MTQEYFYRKTTSAGNRYAYTFSGWVKINYPAAHAYLFTGNDSKDNLSILFFLDNGILRWFDRAGSDASTEQVSFSGQHRDWTEWQHVVFSVDVTAWSPHDRVRCWLNGKQLPRNSSTTLLNNSASFDTPPRNQQSHRINHFNVEHYISSYMDNSRQYGANLSMCDYYFIDGQALTADVFGFEKEGYGYEAIPQGSNALSNNWTRGEWMPKSPRIVKKEIKRTGGFGTNGYYMPMNSGDMVGADFRTSPRTILKIKDDLPQPKAELDGSPLSAVNEDPDKNFLHLAIPGVVDGLGTSGTGDYSHLINGSGTPKSVVPSGALAAVDQFYHGSSAYFDGTDDKIVFNGVPTFGGPTKDLTIEWWMKPESIAGNYVGLVKFTCTTAAKRFETAFHDSKLKVYVGASWSDTYYTPPLNQWTHICIERYNGVFVLYANGEPKWYKNTASVLDEAWTADECNFGNHGNSYPYYSGRMADLRVYIGKAKYKMGFECPKPWMGVNFSSSEQWRTTPDAPRNSFAKLNSQRSTRTPTSSWTNGNLTHQQGTGGYAVMCADIGVVTGKWYWEVRFDTAYLSPGVWGGTGTSGYFPVLRIDAGRHYRRLVGEGSETMMYNTGINQSSGQLMGFALDADNNHLQFYLNGVKHGPILTFSRPHESSWLFPATMAQNSTQTSTSTWNFGQNPTFSGQETEGIHSDENGYGKFKFAVPAGHLALCQRNLPEPTIKNPAEYFRPFLYTGQNSAGQGWEKDGKFDFTPDLIIIKNRARNDGSNGDGYSDFLISDSVRGFDKASILNHASAESNWSDSPYRLSGAGHGKISVGYYYITGFSGDNYVSWVWKAGGASHQYNIDDVGYDTAVKAGVDGGTITPTGISVNTTSKFSIITYSGDGASTGSYKHGLGVAPKLIITKVRGTATNGDWVLWHDNLADGKNVFTNQNNAETAPSYGHITDPTSTLINVSEGSGNQTNASGQDYVTYAWAEVEGYSKIDKYGGNENAQGAFVYTGFRPVFLLVKDIDSANDWMLFDRARSPINPIQNYTTINDDAPDVEDEATSEVDFVCNGFKIRGTGTKLNKNSSTYIYMAFASSPYKYT